MNDTYQFSDLIFGLDNDEALSFDEAVTMALADSKKYTPSPYGIWRNDPRELVAIARDGKLFVSITDSLMTEV